MALITCTECGKQMSDKASACPHCGAPAAVSAAAGRKCGECGAVLPEGAAACPVCGCPVGARQAQPRASAAPMQPMNASIPVQPYYGAPYAAPAAKPKKRVWIPIVIILAIVCVAAAVLVPIVAQNGTKNVVNLPHKTTISFGTVGFSLEGTYNGRCKDDLPQGQGTMVFAENDTGLKSYSGLWKSGYMEGHGVLTYDNGLVIDSEWEHGAPKGRCTATYTNGMVMEMEFSNGFPNGYFKMTGPSGVVLEGELVNGEPRDSITITYPNGDVEMGNFNTIDPYDYLI